MCVGRELEAIIHIIKSSCGSGFLAMPAAFKNIGLLFGTMGTILTGLLCTHCTHLVVSYFLLN